MHSLPDAFDPSFLEGKEVGSICFTAHQINLYLEENVWIQIEGRYRLLRGDDTLEAPEAFPLLRSVLPQLIGKKTIDVSCAPKSGNIEIHFENDLRLQIQGDSGPYESYRLFDGKKETIV